MLFQILTILFPRRPPATAGSVSQVNTNSWRPIVLSHYIHNVLCTQKEKLYCGYCTTEVWSVNMIFFFF